MPRPIQTTRPLGPITLTLIAAVTFLGCYNRYEVRPDELPKLNGAGSAQGVVSTYGFGTNQLGIGSATMVPQVKMIRADGGVAEIRGDSAVEISTVMGSYRFSPPVIAELDADALIVRGGNGGQSFSFDDIDRVTVIEYDPAMTTLAITGITMAVLLPVMLIALSSSSSYDDGYDYGYGY